MPFVVRSAVFSVLSVVFWMPMMLSAQPVSRPDAGVIRQQMERDLPRALPGKRAPLAPLPMEMKSLPGLRITVSRFRFSGNSLLAEDVLHSAVHDFIGRPVDFNGLQQAAAAVAECYRKAGWLAKVYLPRQEIIDGVVTLQIVEAVFGSLRFEGAMPGRIPEKQARAVFDAAQAGGEPLNLNKLDRALLLLDDLPGVAATGNLARGEAQAETDLVLKLTDTPLFAGEVRVDNSGMRSTGEERFSASLRLDSPLKYGDQASLQLMKSQGNEYAQMAYGFPLGHHGLRAGINASYLRYKLVSSDFAGLDARGDSGTWGIDLQYPLLRSRTANLYVMAAYERKGFDNRALGQQNSLYDIDNFGLSLMGNRYDNLGGGGATLGMLTLTRGRVDLDGSPNQAADRVSTQTQGHYSKWRYQFSRHQVLAEKISLTLAWSGQMASKNLDSSEKFYLGGSKGVRAYPTSEAGGSEGSMLNAELRWRPVDDLVLGLFYDWGRVRINRNNDFVGAARINRYALSGWGLSLAWNGPGGLSLQGAWARRIGHNPNPTLTGQDQDGSLIKNRFWLSASLPF